MILTWTAKYEICNLFHCISLVNSVKEIESALLARMAEREKKQMATAFSPAETEILAELVEQFKSEVKSAHHVYCTDLSGHLFPNGSRKGGGMFIKINTVGRVRLSAPRKFISRPTLTVGLLCMPMLTVGLLVCPCFLR